MHARHTHTKQSTYAGYFVFLYVASMSFFSLLLLFDVFIRISFDKMILFFFCCRMLKMLFILFIVHLFVVVRGGIMEFGWCECEVGNECRNSDEIQQNITYVIFSSVFFLFGRPKNLYFGSLWNGTYLEGFLNRLQVHEHIQLIKSQQKSASFSI